MENKNLYFSFFQENEIYKKIQISFSEIMKFENDFHFPKNEICKNSNFIFIFNIILESVDLYDNFELKGNTVHIF